MGSVGTSYCGLCGNKEINCCFCFCSVHLENLILFIIAINQKLIKKFCCLREAGMAQW